MINNGFRERLSLFWSNHFVVEYLDVNQPAYLYKYYKLIQENCLGNFQTFVRKMGLAPAMLMYLNGYQNKKNSPNENYARELYELFTLGEGNGIYSTRHCRNGKSPYRIQQNKNLYGRN